VPTAIVPRPSEPSQPKSHDWLAWLADSRVARGNRTEGRRHWTEVWGVCTVDGKRAEWSQGVKVFPSCCGTCGRGGRAGGSIAGSPCPVWGGRGGHRARRPPVVHESRGVDGAKWLAPLPGMKGKSPWLAGLIQRDSRAILAAGDPRPDAVGLGFDSTYEGLKPVTAATASMGIPVFRQYL